MESNLKKLPISCPSCEARLKVKKLYCSECNTEVDGIFDMPTLAGFNSDEQEFIINFIKASGSLKEMASILNRSYPSVRNILDDVIEKIKFLEKSQKTKSK